MNVLEEYYNQLIRKEGSPNFSELTEEEKLVIEKTIGYKLWIIEWHRYTDRLEQYYNERLTGNGAPNFDELTEEEKSVIADTLGFRLFLGDPNYKFKLDIPKLLDVLGNALIENEIKHIISNNE